jgi:hypothetical protein
MSLTFDFAGAAEPTMPSVKDRFGQPHQFRTKMDVNEARQTRSKSDKNEGKSTKPIDILPLITVLSEVERWANASATKDLQTTRCL